MVYVYYALILKVDEEEFGGHAMLLQEGIMPSTALFMVRPRLCCTNACVGRMKRDDLNIVTLCFNVF